MAFVGEAEKLIEAVSLRMISCRAAQMPLADEPGGVALIVKQFGEKSLFARYARPRLFIPGPDRIELVAKTRRKSTA